MSRSKREFVIVQCPKCGEKSRMEVLASAYMGGWCIGPGERGSHKAASYVIVGRRTRA